MKEVRVCEAMKSPVGTLSDGTVLHQQDGGTKSRQVPIWEKSNLTLEEAAAYSGIGINKLRSLSDNEHCQFVLWVGSKRLIKRRKLDVFFKTSCREWRICGTMNMEQRSFLYRNVERSNAHGNKSEHETQGQGACGSPQRRIPA